MADRAIQESVPLPLARCFRRYRNAEEVRERHDAAYYLFEVYLKYVSTVAIAHYLAGEARDHRANAALKGLARPSLGEWLRFLRECLRFLGEQGCPDPALVALAALYETKEDRWGAVVRLSNGLRGWRTGEARAREKVSLASLLEELVAYRNRVLGHGAPLGGEHYERFAALLGEAFPELVVASPFLTARRLVSFKAPRLIEGTRVECGVVEYMGLHPMRREDPLTLRYGEPVPPEDRLYLSSDEGKLVCLDPLMVAHGEDVYILNEAAGTPEYLSYATGERYRPPGAEARQQEFFGRVLGFEVDSKGLSRIGEDVAAPAAAPAEAAEGERRLGDYRIVREIGRGAMGAVFEAVQESLGRRVALKTLPGDFALDPKRVERFRREARATARIHHPNIVPVYEVGEAGGTHYYAMEFIDGPSLDEVIAGARAQSSGKPAKGSSAGEPQWIASAVERMAALAGGLEEAHRLGLIHRDVKPSNILVDSSGRYILVDFGLVREEEARTLTRSGEQLGTLSYMSPEQVSRRRVDARSDVYSLGVTLYEILTLEPPFRGESEHEIEDAILFREPVAPRKLNPRLHRDLETIVLHALEKDPARRYASAAELAADLKRFLRYEPIRARPPSTLSRVLKQLKRHKARYAAGAAIAALVLVVAVLGLLHVRAQREQAKLEYPGRVREAVLKLQRTLLGIGEIRGGGIIDAIAKPQELALLTLSPGSDPVEEAIQDLEGAIASLKERPDAYYHLARALEFLGRKEEARARLDEALGHDPRFLPAILLRAVIVGENPAPEDLTRLARDAEGARWAEAWVAAQDGLRRRNWKGAIEAFDVLLSKGTSQEPYVGASIEFLLGRGRARMRAGQAGDAEFDFASILTDSPEALVAVLLRGKAMYLQGKVEAAGGFFENHLARTDRKAEAALGIATVMLSLNDYGAAERWIEKSGDPFLVDCVRSVCLYFTGWGFEARAIQPLERAISLRPSAMFPRKLLISALMLDGSGKNLREAETACREALAVDPDSREIEAMLAYILGLRGKPDEAIGRLDAILLEDPDLSSAHLWKARLLSNQGKFRESFKSHNEAIERGNDFSHRWAAVTYAEIGEQGSAIGHLCTAIENNHFAEDYHEDLTNALLDLLRRPWQPRFAAEVSRTVESLERLRRTYAADFPPLLRNLALLHVSNPAEKRPKEALECARRAVELKGRRKHYDLLVLAEIILRCKDRPQDACEAVRCMEEAVVLPGFYSRWVPLLQRSRKAALPHLVSFASADAALDSLEEEELIGDGAEWKYFEAKQRAPTDGLEWTSEDLTDEGWKAGPAGFGFGNFECRTFLPDMPWGYTSLCIRREFPVSDPAEYRELLLLVRSDGGFVAWLNGTEVARFGVVEEPIVAFDRPATKRSSVDPPKRINVPASLLRSGRNCLAVQGWNAARSSQNGAFFLEPRLVGVRGRDPGKERELLEAFKRVASDADAGRVAYLEGRILQRDGNHREAAEKFREATKVDETRPEPWSRLFESLRASGEPAFEADIRSALASSRSWYAKTWTEWLLAGFRDLGKQPEEIFAMLPAPDPKTDTSGGGSATASEIGLADCRWLLEKLKAREPLRINCGSSKDQEVKGVVWSRDRFAVSGNAAGSPEDPIEIAGTDLDAIYRTERWFSPGSEPPGYRIPLPKGTYDLTLHFAEGYFTEEGKRAFRVLIEGKECLPKYMPPLRRADPQPFTGISVLDGCLDITFDHLIENPCIMAIEIRQAE